VRRSGSSLITRFWDRPIIRCATVSNLAAPSFIFRGYSRFTKHQIGDILHMKGVTTMSEMRSLFDALLVLALIVATGTVLGIIFR
jgi:hypothetical protein